MRQFAFVLFERRGFTLRTKENILSLIIYKSDVYITSGKSFLRTVIILDLLFQIVTLLLRGTSLRKARGVKTILLMGGLFWEFGVRSRLYPLLDQIFFILITCLLIISGSDCTERFNVDHFWWTSVKLLLQPQARSFARSLVRSLRLEKEKKG